ncbi:cytidine deaminase [Spiroplasma tabanidicola]|uniref:Cytidine deaminase n=1 Tax=Spiroplasma tabanidicola TaxID=324079 RepID=A0A6I6C8W5_9MOLU|nr:cytidine deaminase [Spiroplasma tabanidicola]QGS52106.1 cytidine deaminase [Spiroplasma tabanidicola]
MDKNDIFKELLELKENAYVPYSGFRVSCIIYLKNNKKIVGVNVENSAYNPTICAERCALPQMISQGYKANDVEVFSLYTDSEILGSPCGTCRQTMIELLNSDQKIWIFNKKGFAGEYILESLLPLSFSKQNLD